jgi:hypothetical protein
VSRAPSSWKAAGTTGCWSLQPAALLSLPFGVLTAASINADTSNGPLHLLGILSLGTLTLLSLVAGFRRDRARLGACELGRRRRRTFDLASSKYQLELALSDSNHTDDLHGRFELRWRRGAEQPQYRVQDDLVPILRDLQSIRPESSAQVQFAAGVPQSVKNLVIGNSDIDLAELRGSETIESPLHRAQLKTAANLGMAAIVALGLVIFLLADQIHRSGNITRLGLGLALALVLLPAMLAVHVAMGRIRIRLDPNRLKVVSRNGLLGSLHWEASASEVQGMWLIEFGEGSLHELVIKSQHAFRSIPLWNSAQPRLRYLIHSLGLGATDPDVHGTIGPLGKTD